MSRLLTFVEAIKEAIDLSMEVDSSVITLGLGATYKNGCDGTTAGLKDKYPGRVFDTPCSENATTGFCTGAAIAGLRPIIYHGRVEFALFAYDQIVTQAAKWHYMFDSPVPAVYRIAVGRRWGDAPQHTSVMHTAFAHVPGLKVVVPSTPRIAKGLLITAIFDNNPVVFLEHRWLYGIKESVPPDRWAYPLDAAHIKIGSDVTIVAMADTFLEAYRALPVLKSCGINPEIIDLVSLRPVDYKSIIESVRGTGRLIVADVGTKAYGIGSEIIARVCEEAYDSLEAPPINLGAAESPCPMSTALTARYYPIADDIIDAVAEMMDVEIDYEKRSAFKKLHVPPDDNFDILEKGAMP